jgi:RNA polymerase sigma-70 factor (ECF subfamily)
VREPTEPARRQQVERYLHAFERSDIDGLTQILREDVRLEMPPHLTWFRGRAAVGRFLAGRIALEGRRVRMVPIAANGQPGFASYLLHGDGTSSAHAIHLLSPTDSGLGAVHVFLQPSLFEVFGLAAN